MKHVNFDYKGARDMSWEVLIRFQIQRLPVKVSEIGKRAGFIVRSYTKGEQEIVEFGLQEQMNISDGFTVLKNGKYYIFYNNKMPVGRIRFTIAHELGHIFMGHIREEGQVTRRNREPEAKDLPIEHEANVFASRLLAPAYVLHDIGAFTPERIANVCDISLQSATYRAGRMGTLEARQKYGAHPMEREAHALFRAYIEEMRQSS